MSSRQCGVFGVAGVALAILASGCLDRELKPLNPCLVSGVSRKVSIKNVDKIDLLIVVDNSNSMAQEQISLKEQFPKLINVLTTGERFAGDPDPFPAVTDLHVGIVSSDMGTAGFELDTCHADGGDDGKLQYLGRADGGSGCDAMTFPPFLSFTATPRTDSSTGEPTVTNTDTFAYQVGCIATLGVGGCGFEQQLEAPFKALWPRTYRDPVTNTAVTPNPVSFLIGTGRGDIPTSEMGNLGFLRNDPTQGLSLIAILVVTDEEDCSVSSNDHLKTDKYLPADSPYRAEKDLNLRCFQHPDKSWPVEERYLKGFQGLRPGNEGLVVFAAITGVPVDLVSKDKLPDFSDQAARDQFYDDILNDPSMIETIDPGTNPGGGMGNLKPSCRRTVNGAISTAYPPRRIVQLAKAFGTNGIVQSICQDDFSSAMSTIIDIIAKQLGEVCLPRKLVRQSTGKVACNVVWELPPPGVVAEDVTPTQCDQRSFLMPVDTGRATTNGLGGVNCKVAQLPVLVDSEDPTVKSVPEGDGWYYDDFREDLKKTCKATEQQRVSFTTNAKPPTGVTVKLECLNETQRYVSTDTNVAPNQPEIGSPCLQDSECLVRMLNTDTPDESMFCHPDLNVCQRHCTSSTECPPAWVCDPRQSAALGGKGYCVNPTCGAELTTD